VTNVAEIGPRYVPKPELRRNKVKPKPEAGQAAEHAAQVLLHL
jgi:hypothetical protein